MKVFLIGFMGCGKTYIGKKLADILYFPFVDIDKIIENTEGDTIANMFEQKGETYFRKLESDCLKTVTKWEDVVVATGGGAPCFHDNMDWMNKKGITIYLKTNPELLLNRLIKGADKRPLLKDKNEEELLEFIIKRVAEREAFYNKAHIIIAQEQNDEEGILKTIEENLMQLSDGFKPEKPNI